MMITGRRLRAFARHNRPIGALWISCVLLAIELGLRLLRLTTLARALRCPLALDPEESVADFDGTSAPTGANRPFSPRELLRIADTERVLRHWPPGGTCLRRALLVGWVLRRRRPVLRVGVAKIDGVVKAHAWLEIEGHPLNPLDPPGYQALRSVDMATTRGTS